MNMNLILKALSNPARQEFMIWLKSPHEHFNQADNYVDIQKVGVCVGLIQKKSGLSQSTTSHYLKLLEQAELIITERHGQWTYCRRNGKTIAAFVKQLKESL